MGFCFGDATALDESSHSKDPFFVLDLEWSKISANNNTSTSSGLCFYLYLSLSLDFVAFC